MKPLYTVPLILFAIALLMVLMKIRLTAIDNCSHAEIEYVETSISKLKNQKEIYYDKICAICGEKFGYINDIAYYEIQLETTQTILDSLYGRYEKR